MPCKHKNIKQVFVGSGVNFRHFECQDCRTPFYSKRIWNPAENKYEWSNMQPYVGKPYTPSEKAEPISAPASTQPHDPNAAHREVGDPRTWVEPTKERERK